MTLSRKRFSACIFLLIIFNAYSAKPALAKKDQIKTQLRDNLKAVLKDAESAKFKDEVLYLSEDEASPCCRFVDLLIAKTLTVDTRVFLGISQAPMEWSP